MPECQYPPCVASAEQSRGLVVMPEPISVNLCREHYELFDGNRSADNLDFWRWAQAMLDPSRG